MSEHINGKMFSGLFDYGLKNLSAHRDQINPLNVFPVPDGATGTNMVLTLDSGVSAAENKDGLPSKAQAFANAVVFGARGNSGVILSQFLRGFCEKLSLLDKADVFAVSDALNFGVETAYKAVSNPVEGTMLTVLRQSAEKVNADVKEEKLSTIENVLSTATHFKLKTYKDNGVVYEEHRTDDRLAVTP